MSNSEIEQSGTVKGHLPNEASLSGRISNGLSLSGHISIGGAGDLIIKMKVTSDDDINYTVTSCDATVEQIDAAVAAEKRVVVIASYGGFIIELPMLQGVKGDLYYFGTFVNGFMTISFVKKIDESTSEWQFEMNRIQAESVDYYNDALPNVTDVEAALDALVPNSHTHSNKLVLDKFAESDGKPTYAGQAIGGGASTAEDIAYTNSKVPSSQQEYGVKGALDFLLSYTPHTHNNRLALDKLSTDNANSTNLYVNGRSNTIAFEPKIYNYASYTSETLNLTNNCYYILRQVHKLTINPPSTPTVAADIIWITFADEGYIELAFPTTVKYIGKIPTVNNGETLEITIINKVVSIQKVGEGA